VTPDAASGGPLALVRTGDRTRLSVKERRIDLLVAEDELRSPAAATPPAAPPMPERGYGRLYARKILGAEEACDFGFLRLLAVSETR
jgi:dihydroxy-acid dehydratase